MKDIYKNPTLYYILVPGIIALWPLLIWAVYLPKAEDNWKDDKAQYSKAQEIIAEILVLDPDRLELTGAKDAGAEFDYANAVEQIARLCKISATSYKLSSGRIVTTTGGQKSQSANVSLIDVEINKFAEFLSTMQLRWASLQCVQLRKLTKKKALPDRWDAELQFKYYY